MSINPVSHFQFGPMGEVLGMGNIDVGAGGAQTTPPYDFAQSAASNIAQSQSVAQSTSVAPNVAPQTAFQHAPVLTVAPSALSKKPLPNPFVSIAPFSGTPVPNPSPPPTPAPSAASASPSSPPPAPTTNIVPIDFTGVPEWLALPVAEFAQAPGGKELRVILDLLVALERRLEWGGAHDGGKGLKGANYRPLQVGVWIKNARAVRPRLAAKDMSKFITRWKTWWGSLQGGWRVRNDDDTWDRRVMKVEVWDTLESSGKNGLLSVVAVLSWWGEYVQVEEGKISDELVEEMADVEWTLRGCLHALG